MQLTFYGAAGEVTGSCHILTVAGRRLLLDCGMIQGGASPDLRNRADFPFDAAQVDAVILSHAHIDHSGRLPLVRILLADSATMQERDAERANRRREKAGGKGHAAPLYTLDDALDVLQQVRTVRYELPVEVLPGVEVTFRDAGHILGSASVWLTLREGDLVRRLTFSGDIGQYDTPILRDPEAGPATDLVLMESTYGARLHRDRAATLEEFGRILRDAKRDGGNVLIPAFAVGRSQEILYELATHYDAWELADWRVFLDSPMAIEATGVYWRHAELFDAEAQEWHAREQALPALPNLALCRTADESMAINRLTSGALVIAGSGMCTGGRIVHHLKHNLARRECDVIFSGFQAEGTLGRAIVDGRETVRIHGSPVKVAARVHTLGGFSAHGDQQDLLRWYGAIPGQPPVWLVHGETSAAEGLRDALRQRGSRVEVAVPGITLDLAVAA
jgi:metallo-beta-lactamase family protein